MLLFFNRCTAAVAPSPLALLLTAALAFAPLSVAQAQAQGSFLDSLDFDGDGVVTVDEATLSRNLAFDRTDSNGDGRLDAAEFDAMLQGARQRYDSLGQNYRAERASPGRIDAFTFADSDADGTVSRQEFSRSSARFSRSLDRDGDGVITAMELVH